MDEQPTSLTPQTYCPENRRGRSVANNKVHKTGFPNQVYVLEKGKCRTGSCTWPLCTVWLQGDGYEMFAKKISKTSKIIIVITNQVHYYVNFW